MDIRIQAPSDEKFQEVLEVLKPLGVEVITGEDNPLVAALFYIARMNSKLDNLGQLKHLHKLLQYMSTLTTEYVKSIRSDEHRFILRTRYNKWLYDSLVEEHGRDPLREVVGKDRDLLVAATAVLTSDEIHAMFT